MFPAPSMHGEKGAARATELYSDSLVAPIDGQGKPAIDGKPCSIEVGNPSRVVFQRDPGLCAEERWQDRRVRALPHSVDRLAYYCNLTGPPAWVTKMAWHNLPQLILRDHGFDRAKSMDENWNIFWCKAEVPLEAIMGLQPGQKVNKFPRATSLTKKKAMAANLLHMRTTHGEEAYGFLPDTFVLPQQRAELEQHMRARRRALGGARDIWVLKPAQGTNGRGIFLHRADGKAREEEEEEEPEPAANGTPALPKCFLAHDGVACRYVDPPLLIDGLKSDVRLYVLVTSFHPLVAYTYHEGLARFATEPYSTASASDLENRCGHLTNFALNRHSAKFAGAGGGSDGHKWSLMAYRARMERELGEEAAAGAWRAVDDLIVKALIAVEPPISEAMEEHLPAAAAQSGEAFCFTLFGFDILFDASAKPWLLEVNIDPSLDIDTPLDLAIKPTLIVDMLNLVGVPVAPAAAGTAPSDAEMRIVQRVNAEYQRSKRDAGGRWRRLFPCLHAKERFGEFFAPQRTLHWLPFEGTGEASSVAAHPALRAEKARRQGMPDGPSEALKRRSCKIEPKSDLPAPPKAWVPPRSRTGDELIRRIGELQKWVETSANKSAGNRDAMPARPLPGRLSSHALQIGGADGRTGSASKQPGGGANMGANAFRLARRRAMDRMRTHLDRPVHV